MSVEPGGLRGSHSPGSAFSDGEVVRLIPLAAVALPSGTSL